MGDAHKKTGGQETSWIEFDSPKPPPVEDRYKYWGNRPQEISERCRWWLHQIERGWRPNRHIRAEGYDASAGWYGVYIWEYINLIAPATWREGS
jgi:hypothetical protein